MQQMLTMPPLHEPVPPNRAAFQMTPSTATAPASASTAGVNLSLPNLLQQQSTLAVSESALPHVLTASAVTTFDQQQLQQHLLLQQTKLTNNSTLPPPPTQHHQLQQNPLHVHQQQQHHQLNTPSAPTTTPHQDQHVHQFPTTIQHVHPALLHQDHAPSVPSPPQASSRDPIKDLVDQMVRPTLSLPSRTINKTSCLSNSLVHLHQDKSRIQATEPLQNLCQEPSSCSVDQASLRSILNKFGKKDAELFLSKASADSSPAHSPNSASGIAFGSNDQYNALTGENQFSNKSWNRSLVINNYLKLEDERIQSLIRKSIVVSYIFQIFLIVTSFGSCSSCINSHELFTSIGIDHILNSFYINSLMV